MSFTNPRAARDRLSDYKRGLLAITEEEGRNLVLAAQAEEAAERAQFATIDAVEAEHQSAVLEAAQITGAAEAKKSRVFNLLSRRVKLIALCDDLERIAAIITESLSHAPTERAALRAQAAGIVNSAGWILQGASSDPYTYATYSRILSRLGELTEETEIYQLAQAANETERAAKRAELDAVEAELTALGSPEEPLEE